MYIAQRAIPPTQWLTWIFTSFSRARGRTKKNIKFLLKRQHMYLMILIIINMYDFEHSVGEDRYIAIGKVGDVLFFVFTERKETIRLLSARLATNAERELYYDQNINY